ncbi:MAG: hypothetical protein JSV38_14145, partial [Desulfobacterales bacterium]
MATKIACKENMLYFLYHFHILISSADNFSETMGKRALWFFMQVDIILEFLRAFILGKMAGYRLLYKRALIKETTKHENLIHLRHPRKSRASVFHAPLSRSGSS